MTNFGTIWPPIKPPIPPNYQQSTLNDSNSLKSLHKSVLLETGFISILFEAKMLENCPKCHISCNFCQFWDHMTHSKTPYTTKKVHCRALILPKYSRNSTTRKWIDSFLSFSVCKCSKSAQNVIFLAILANFGTIRLTQKRLTLPKKYITGLIFSGKSP